jgi:hypothetical protein
MPAALTPVDARLMLTLAADDAHRSEISLQAPFPAPYRELWRIEAAFAPIPSTSAQAIQAFFEALDGRAKAVRWPLTAPVWGNTPPAGVTLAGSVAAGAEVLSLSIPSGTVFAGTLIGLGDVETAQFQLFEVSADVSAGASVTTPVAPRARRAFASNTPFQIGSVNARFYLATDASGMATIRVNGAADLQISAVEAVQ